MLNLEVLNDDGTIRSVTHKRHGYGIKQFEDGSRYTGLWKNNIPNGQGKFDYANGDVFTGNFVSGLMEGKGDMVKATGENYSGQF